MDARFERYIENLRTVRTLSQPKFSPDMKAKELLETIQSNAIKCFDYMKENNAILNELVFQRAPAELTSAEIASLQEFADKMFNYASSEDCGIAYKVYSLLLENARIRGDKPAIVRYLYGKAVSLHYLNVRGRDYAINPYGTQVRGLFREGAGYIAEYESFDKTTKGYIMRCLGNSRMSMPRSTPEECTEYMKVFDKAMGIITDPYYHQLDPDLPWGKFEYAMHMDRETLLSYLRHHNDPVVAAKVMESAEAIYRDRVLYKGEEARLQNWRVSYLYKAACFHAGRCTAREVVEELLDIIHHTDIQDYSDTGINKNLTAVSYLVAYEVKMPPADRREMACRTEEVMDRSLRYLNNVPQNQYSRVVSRAVRELVEMQAEAGTARRSLLNYILVAHKPTYVHSMMVAGLTRMFVKQMLKKSPELFVGVMGCKTVEEVRRSRIEICELAYECGLYHDVGKSYVFMYIGNNYRRLLDEEFTCIQWHTVFGYELLCNVGGKDDLAPAAGLVLGAVGLLRLEEAAGRLMHTGSKEHGRMGRVVLAVTLHNLPEGMVVGLAAALALQGEPEAVSGALALALGIGLQNIPEGAAVSLPLAQAGQGRRKAVGAGAASGLVEPLGALLALALAGWVSAALPWLMSAAAGCMVCVTAQEMIPEAVEQDEPTGVISVVLGFALMMALDIAL